MDLNEILKDSEIRIKTFNVISYALPSKRKYISFVTYCVGCKNKLISKWKKCYQLKHKSKNAYFNIRVKPEIFLASLSFIRLELNIDV